MDEVPGRLLGMKPTLVIDEVLVEVRREARRRRVMLGDSKQRHLLLVDKRHRGGPKIIITLDGNTTRDRTNQLTGVGFYMAGHRTESKGSKMMGDRIRNPMHSPSGFHSSTEPSSITTQSDNISLPCQRPIGATIQTSHSYITVF